MLLRPLPVIMAFMSSLKIFVRKTLPSTIRRFDKGGENFYDQISALHKSVRGSDPDAALYWMCRMLDGGVDPLYLGRRLVRMSIEDISLADPRAITLASEASGSTSALALLKVSWLWQRRDLFSDGSENLMLSTRHITK